MRKLTPILTLLVLTGCATAPLKPPPLYNVDDLYPAGLPGANISPILSPEQRRYVLVQDPPQYRLISLYLELIEKQGLPKPYAFEVRISHEYRHNGRFAAVSLPDLFEDHIFFDKDDHIIKAFRRRIG